ncbi:MULTISPECIES: hypothetical protein [Gordonia]|uniref:Trp biosynthesis associated, transmembrane protein, Oprn/Chp n=1 Tax=Gordonia alkanivorans CGMCC 6845 TaxID=1423140 RepID=W9D9K2_9ACTN|nr:MULTISPECIES: hypothetical protein [Gordonia]ETA06023.1 hypothetical protein V525_15195 [Gordonia alkanivorans CGMCC 6845]MDH3007493.1 hypothetical protein [Gordonia alkanivorans]MDH3013702.1 hypothetical protein [Gordonia alkanivorans]MDH3015318.1 hypothetical protein [Gordonia alkanivorans]MDH3022497.1 hypothetical protein [Gordonia alkanivorans]
MSMPGDAPPPRPRVAVTPMRPQRTTERAGPIRWVVLGWIVTVALTLVTVLLIVASLDDLRSVLAADLIREHPDSGTDAGRAVDISLLIGAGLALVVVVLGVAGAVRLWAGRRAGRMMLTVGALVATVGAVGFRLTVDPSTPGLADAGLPAPVLWLPVAAAAIALIATGVTFTRAVSATLR